MEYHNRNHRLDIQTMKKSTLCMRCGWIFWAGVCSCWQSFALGYSMGKVMLKWGDLYSDKVTVHEMETKYYLFAANWKSKLYAL